MHVHLKCLIPLVTQTCLQVQNQNQRQKWLSHKLKPFGPPAFQKDPGCASDKYSTQLANLHSSRKDFLCHTGHVLVDLYHRAEMRTWTAKSSIKYFSSKYFGFKISCHHWPTADSCHLGDLLSLLGCWQLVPTESFYLVFITWTVA